VAVKATLGVRIRRTQALGASALRGRGRRLTSLPNSGLSVGLSVGLDVVLRAGLLNGGEPGTISGSGCRSGPMQCAGGWACRPRARLPRTAVPPWRLACRAFSACGRACVAAARCELLEAAGSFSDGMRVTADGERRRDTQVGVFVKAPAVTVLDVRPGGLGADRLVAAA